MGLAGWKRSEFELKMVTDLFVIFSLVVPVLGIVWYGSRVSCGLVNAQ